MIPRVHEPRALNIANDNVPGLEPCPKKRRVRTRLYTSTPKKPNAALRNVCRVRLNNVFEFHS